MTVLSGSSAGKMMTNEVMMAAKPMGAAPCPGRAGRRGFGPFGAAAQLGDTAAEGLAQATSPPGTGSVLRQRTADRDCRRPGDGATPLRIHGYTQREPWTNNAS